MTRWEASLGLEDILREIARSAERGSTPIPRGYSADQIAEREKDMAWPIPEDIRKLYLWFTPTRWKAAIENGISPDSLPPGAPPWFTNPYLMPLEEAGWQNRHSDDISKNLKLASDAVRGRAGNWETTFNFCFAATDYGEEISYCLNPPEFSRGLIVCWHEAKFERGILLGNSVAQWLARFHECGNCEYAFAPGNIDPTEDEKEFDGEKGLEEPLRSQFLRDHLRLNHADEYARSLLFHKFGEQGDGLVKAEE